MALQVWLPLNGNLNNQGLDDINVTNNGATFDDNGKIGKCISFNGISSCLKYSPFNIGNKWSIGFWMKTNILSGDRYILSLNNNSGYSDQQIAFALSDSSFVYVVNGTIYNLLCSDIGIEIGKWIHIIATYNENNISIYINGEKTINKNITTSLLSRVNLTIGARNNNGGNAYYFNGYINDLRIYDHCLSPKEVKEISKGLILHYPMNQPERCVSLSSTTTNHELSFGLSPLSYYSKGNIYIQNTGNNSLLFDNSNHRLILNTFNDDSSDYNEFNGIEYDCSGYANNGIVEQSTSPTFYTDSPRYNGCYNFDSSLQNVITLPSNNLTCISNNGIFTISCWFKTDGMGEGMSYGGIISLGYGIVIRIASSKTIHIRLDDGSSLNNAYTSSKVIDSNWHLVVFTYDGSKIKLYIDGCIDGEVSRVFSNRYYNLGEFIIGADTNYTPVYRYNGCLSDVRIYATSLSDEDVLELYQTSAIISR